MEVVTIYIQSSKPIHLGIDRGQILAMNLKEKFVRLSVSIYDTMGLCVVWCVHLFVLWGFFVCFGVFCVCLVLCLSLDISCFFVVVVIPLNWYKLCWSPVKLIRYVQNNDNLNFLYFRIQQEQRTQQITRNVRSLSLAK